MAVKYFQYFCGSLISLVSISTAFIGMGMARPIERINPNIKIKPILQPQPQFPRPILQCIDPATESINFQIIRRDTQFKGKVRITGVMKNIGTLPYQSNPNQQALLLYENNKLVKRTSFQNLSPGSAMTIAYDRDWNSSSPAEGEFPPEYKLLITYDPDIRLDGNPRNDDCRNSNNQKVASGQSINQLLR